MSTRMYRYLGPYLECRPEMVPSTATAWACPNESCEHAGRNQYGYYKFCPACSTLLADKPEPGTQPAVNAWEARGAIREALHQAEDEDGDRVYWMPNVDRNRPRDYDLEDDGAIPITPADIAADVAWFRDAFAPEIAVLIGLYGDGRAGVRWGVVAWWN